MFIQQLIALIVIAFFIGRLFVQRRREHINNAEFGLWLTLWLLVAAAVLLLRPIDAFVQSLGFSASGIDVLLYVAVLLLFYFVFRLRLRAERAERAITRITEHVAISKEDERAEE